MRWRKLWPFRSRSQSPVSTHCGPVGGAGRYQPCLECLEGRINPSPMAIPQHAEDLGVAQLAYQGVTISSPEDDLLANSVDLAVVDP